MEKFENLSPIVRTALLGALMSHHPGLQARAEEQQRREVLANRLAFAYGVTVNEVYDTATTYPWTFETFYTEAMAGRVILKRKMRQERIPNGD